jgi:hypothetical protein
MPNQEPLVIPETLRIQRSDGDILEMPLDEYLKDVVPTEMGLAKPIEALKAQAIASRSFAVVTRRHARDGFDVCTTTHCQVWKPGNRYPDADRAVDETEGLVLTYENQSVAAHFFAHCDGRTRNSEDVWSGAVAYCRSVPCICGYTTLYGHGVGMCQRGAAAMAEGGATAEEILQHYYTSTGIGQATAIPRTQFQRSVILGELVDDQGNPRAGVELVLRGPTGAIARRTNDQGQFWISSLPAGDWELEIKDKPVRYKGIRTDGRNTLDLRVGVPDTTPEALKTMPLGHPRQLIGTLGCDDVQVVMTDAAGKQTVLLGGSAPDFGPGGFAIPLPESGAYTIDVLGQRFDLEVGDTGVWLQFVPRPE